jgi:hypothetical protein
MADKTIYVDYYQGNDAWDGTAPSDQGSGVGPFKHISAAIADLPNPVQPGSDAYVYLRGIIATNEDYNYGADDPSQDTEVDLSSITFGAGGALLIATYYLEGGTAEKFDLDKYANGLCPYFDGSGALDPTAAKPCTIPQVVLGNNVSQDISILGVAIAPYQSTSRTDKGVDFDEETEDVNLVFCKVSNFGIGVYGVEDAEIVLENCFLDNNTYGLVADAETRAILAGNNFIRNSLTNGIVLRAGAHLVLMPWNHNRGSFNNLRIYTDVQRSGYAAIQASLGSLIMLEPAHRDFFTNDADQVFIKIINEAAFNAKDYYGIVLESRAMLTGKDNICFTDQSFNQGQPTVPSGSQIVTAASNNSVVAG